MNKLDLEETTRRFHNVYEKVAKEYGYKTREDTKELDFNSPNGMTMLKTVETITTPYLEEIERLNNIINELEKWLEEQHQFIIEIPAFTKEISIEHKTMEICYENILDKIQELKGEDKE